MRSGELDLSDSAEWSGHGQPSRARRVLSRRAISRASKTVAAEFAAKHGGRPAVADLAFRRGCGCHDVADQCGRARRNTRRGQGWRWGRTQSGAIVIDAGASDPAQAARSALSKRAPHFGRRPKRPSILRRIRPKSPGFGRVYLRKPGVQMTDAGTCGRTTIHEGPTAVWRSSCARATSSWGWHCSFSPGTSCITGLTTPVPTAPYGA